MNRPCRVFKAYNLILTNLWMETTMYLNCGMVYLRDNAKIMSDYNYENIWEYVTETAIKSENRLFVIFTSHFSIVRALSARPFDKAFITYFSYDI